MKKLYILILLSYLITTNNLKGFAQSVLNPADTIVEYDANNPPVEPPYGEIGKWVRTKSLSWNSNDYKAYIYEGSCFRLKFPKTYNSNSTNGKKYPLAIVFHGLGEAGPITDNEQHLYHGGQEYKAVVDNGTFDGYVLFMQSQGSWGTSSYQKIIDIINYMIANNGVDPFRITVNGLSAGGQASWDMVMNYPSYIGGSLPMSNVSIGYKDSLLINIVKFTPIWNFQGGLDGSPSPSTAQQVRDAMLAAGADYKYSEYANTGHNTWDSAYADTGFFKFIAGIYSSNPQALYGRTKFCDGDTINITLGLASGFDNYQWRKNGIIINNETGNTLHVSNLGNYDARVLRNGFWSDWSHTPITVQIAEPTQTPPVTVAGKMSNAIVSADGKKYVDLEVKGDDFIAYKWKKVGKDSIISTQKIFSATEPGKYVVAATQLYGCSSNYSPAFAVINANGQNAPDAAKNLIARSTSSTEILLSWENNPHPIRNESFFEIFRSTSENGVYNFIDKTPADILKYNDINLSPGTNYFYKIRAINDSGAALVSNIATATTIADKTPPTAPVNLRVNYSTNSSVKFQWSASIDDVGVAAYNIYINGLKSYVTSDTIFVVNALEKGKVYSFAVRADDSSGNLSPQSNIANSPAVLNGLVYKYYEGYFYSMPDFNTLKPVKTGVSANLDLNVTARKPQVALLWQGSLNVPQSGNYKFQITSDDGSKFWLNNYDASINALTSYDTTQPGLTYASSTINLTKGFYPVSVAYYQASGSKSIKLSWSNAELFGDTLFHKIEDVYFRSDYVAQDTAPKLPDSLVATALASDKIKITWRDLSTNETGFQIYRSLQQNADFNIIYTTAANVTSYKDTLLNANTKYYYKINAVNSYGNSTFSKICSVTTLSTQNAPASPLHFIAKSLSSSAIQLSWDTSHNTYLNFQLYRSVGDTLNFQPKPLLPNNIGIFNDTALYGNTVYYYKIKSLTTFSGIFSVDKPAIKAQTKNNAPVIEKFKQKYIPYGMQTIVSIAAADTDADKLSFSAKALPSFAGFIDNGNGTASLIFNPSISQQGNYNNIKIYVKDAQGATDSNIFKLTVNNNFYPVIDSVADYNIDEGDSVLIPLSATDANTADTLKWFISNAPKNYTQVPVANGKINLRLTPGFATAGIYKIQAKVVDGNNGSAIKEFNVTVNDKDPNTIVNIRFKDQDSIASPWNNVSGNITNGFKDFLNRSTTIGLEMQGGWFSTWHEGPQTGNNSGIYPDAVLKDYYYFGAFGAPDVVTNKITGLDTSKLYDISFYAGSNWSQVQDNGSTIYTIGSKSVSLNVQNNTLSTADFNGIKPAADGSINFTMSKGINAAAGYLNAIIIRNLCKDSSKPAAATYVTASNIAGKGVQITWNDVAYNESSYKVFRSTNKTSNFILVSAVLPVNSTSFLDTTAAGNTQYYYMVKASNTIGITESENVASVLTFNRVPKINAIANVILKNNQQKTITVTVVDDKSDKIVITAANLPSFITFTDNKNATGTLIINPANGISGTFENIIIKATDKSDSSSSISFSVTIADQNLTSVYLNFSDGSIASSPWNNLNAFPATNSIFNNLLDDNGDSTIVSLKLLTGFQGNFTGGIQATGKGIYPDIVTRSGWYNGDSAASYIQVSGLDNSKKYNFTFFNSHDDGLKGNTGFSMNNQNVTLNAAHNINTTAAINGIKPLNSQVTIKILKLAGEDYAYINSLVIQSYDSSLKLLSPSELRVNNITKKSVALQWADRSADETGFEIWRSTDSNLTFTLLQTVAANQTSFIDSGVVSAHTYYYTIRAVNTGAQSSFANTVSATTYTQAVYVNFTFTNSARLPWNNTSALPEKGLTWKNFMDDLGVPSSIGMTETGSFAGLYDAGVNSINGSGIYPDAVIADSYGLFPGQNSSLKISGLNLNMNYDFTFFASSQAYGDVNTAYTINGKKAVLNASLNTNGTVTIYNVTPDKNGEVIISIAPNSTASQLGLIGSLVIQEYKLSNIAFPAAPQLLNKKTINLVSNVTAQSIKQTIVSKENTVNVFPNPFAQYINVSLSIQKDDDVRVELFSMNGQLVLSKNLGLLSKGSYNFQFTPAASLSSGIYILKISYTQNKFYNSIKILKQ